MFINCTLDFHFPFQVTFTSLHIGLETELMPSSWILHRVTPGLVRLTFLDLQWPYLGDSKVSTNIWKPWHSAWNVFMLTIFLPPDEIIFFLQDSFSDDFSLYIFPILSPLNSQGLISLLPSSYASITWLMWFCHTALIIIDGMQTYLLLYAVNSSGIYVSHLSVNFCHAVDCVTHSHRQIFLDW